VRTPRKTDEAPESQSLSSPPQDTQPLSQFVDAQAVLADEVEDEVKEGVWGYLVPLDPKYGEKPIVLKKRNACPKPDAVEVAKNEEAAGTRDKPTALRQEEAYERTKIGSGAASGGYLIGRHPECGMCIWYRADGDSGWLMRCRRCR
jgi:serine/threonine-protein kinase CHEK2